TWYFLRKSSLRLAQFDVVSKWKPLRAACSGNQTKASWRKLMCAWSCLPVKNPIALKRGASCFAVCVVAQADASTLTLARSAVNHRDGRVRVMGGKMGAA